MDHPGTLGCASFVQPTPCAVVSGGYFLSCSLDEWIDWLPLLGVAEPCWCKQTVAIRVWINKSGTAPGDSAALKCFETATDSKPSRLKTTASSWPSWSSPLSCLCCWHRRRRKVGWGCCAEHTVHISLKWNKLMELFRQLSSHEKQTDGLFSFLFLFCQAHHCGAFIQKHSSILTIFLSLTHSHVFVWFFSHMYFLHYASSPWSVCTVVFFKLCHN